MINTSTKYFRDANNIPLLVTISDDTTPEQLVKSHLRAVTAHARKFYSRSPYLDDIIQEGNLALVKAAEKFDPSLGFAFYTYAQPMFVSAMRDAHIRTRSQITLFTTHALRKAYFNIDKYRNGHNVLTEEQANRMAEELNIPIEDVRGCEERLNAATISDFTKSDDDDDISVLEGMGDLNYEPCNVLENLEHHNLLTNGISNAIATLNEREQYIIKSCWMTDPPKSMSDIAREQGVSPQRIDQIAKKAMKRLRAQLEEVI